MNKKIMIPILLVATLSIGHITQTMVKEVSQRDKTITTRMISAGQKGEKIRTQWLKAKADAKKVVADLRAIENRIEAERKNLPKANIFQKAAINLKIGGLRLQHANKSRALKNLRARIKKLELPYSAGLVSEAG